MGHFIQNPRTSCALGGALATLSSIERAIPIFHAGPGCGLQTMAGQFGQAGGKGFGYVGGQGVPSTNMFEKEVIFGGSQRLKETITGSLEVMDGDLFVVMTGCTAGIIGDDVQGVVDQFKDSEAPIIYVETSGFKGDTYYGYEAILNTLTERLVEPSSKESLTINLLGIVPTQDIFWEGNFEELIRILTKLGLKVNTFFTGHQGLAALKRSSGAVLNLILSPWLLEKFSENYQNRFGIETLRYPGLPIGPTATSDFIRRLSGRLSLDRDLVEQVIGEEEDYVYSYIEKIIGSLTRYRFIIVGDTNTVLGLTRFLVNDYGQIPLCAIITDDVPEKYRPAIEQALTTLEFARRPQVVFENDKWAISERIRFWRDEATLILGSDYEKEIGVELGILTNVVTFPTTERLVINRGYAGYRGCLTFLEDLYDNN